MWLFNQEIEHFPILDEAFQTVVYLNRAYSCRGSGVDEVADLKRYEPGNIGNDMVDAEQHIVGVALLNGITVNIEPKGNGQWITQL